MTKPSNGKQAAHCQSCIEKEFPIYDVTGTHYTNGILDGVFTDVTVIGNVQVDPIGGLQYSDGAIWNSYPAANYTNVDLKLYDNGCDSYIAMICQKNQNLEAKIGNVTLQPCGFRELVSADATGNLSLVKSTFDIKLPKCGSCIEQDCKDQPQPHHSMPCPPMPMPCHQVPMMPCHQAPMPMPCHQAPMQQPCAPVHHIPLPPMTLPQMTFQPVQQVITQPAMVQPPMVHTMQQMPCPPMHHHVPCQQMHHMDHMPMSYMGAY